MFKRYLGFTLIELIVALFIFAIVSLLAIRGMQNILLTTSAINQHNQRLGEIQLAILIMDRDITQIVDRPVIDKNNSVLAAITGNNHQLEFTHMGYANPLAEMPRGTLQRTAYLLINNQLIRQTWPVLDRAPSTTVNNRVLLSQVTKFDVQYISANLTPADHWPITPDQIKILPVAVSITITLKDTGSINRIYLVTSTTNDES